MSATYGLSPTSLLTCSRRGESRHLDLFSSPRQSGQGSFMALGSQFHDLGVSSFELFGAGNCRRQVLGGREHAYTSNPAPASSFSNEFHLRPSL